MFWNYYVLAKVLELKMDPDRAGGETGQRIQIVTGFRRSHVKCILQRNAGKEAKNFENFLSVLLT